MKWQSLMDELGTPAPRFAVPDAAGRVHRLEDFSGSPALLVTFICNHCPFVLHILDSFVDYRRSTRLGVLPPWPSAPTTSPRIPKMAPNRWCNWRATGTLAFPTCTTRTKAPPSSFTRSAPPTFSSTTMIVDFIIVANLMGHGRRRPTPRADPAPARQPRVSTCVRPWMRCCPIAHRPRSSDRAWGAA